MNYKLRKTVIAGNWKMNKTPAETKTLLREIKDEIAKLGEIPCGVVACVPFVDLQTALEEAVGSKIKIGAQNVHWAEAGAFTGEVSPKMLKELGVEFVIVGHSERRQFFGETDDTVNSRAKAAIAAGLNVILCVGELLGEREKGITAEVVSRQVKIALCGISEIEMKNVIIAYEPVWAIGTGKTATSGQAGEVCGVIRDIIAGIYGRKSADAVSILYGGSMNAKNAAELLAMPDVDGGLIGGASLKAEDFAAIIAATRQ